MMRTLFLITSVGSLIINALVGYWYPLVWLSMVVLGPIIMLGLYDVIQTRRALLRNFPVIGHIRYGLEAVSQEIQQYLIERHTDGMPISRNHRAVINKRADDISATHPFGTELDLYRPQLEGLKHSLYPQEPLQIPPRIRIGGDACRRPYAASLYNISAMSFGAISRNAVLAMNEGAKIGGFYLNTGEGGLSRYHLQPGGDLVWQIGTGYFGCRIASGRFSADEFAKRAEHANVKMIELKLSQGAKPGHGGVLPAVKNTEEIAAIRGLEPHTLVLSPPAHPEFSDVDGLLRFIQLLRELSGGKPVGFKLCIGRQDEFVAVCEAMNRSGILPDFITVDGAEGGTGAAPLEFSDSVGTPLEPALAFVHQTLRQHGLRERIRLIAGGKMVTAASIVRILALGADLCNGARAFMMAVGCIQALRCDTNHCPTGVATQRESLVKGLVVEHKAIRVANFHKNTVKSVMELIAACGVRDLEELSPDILINGTDWSGAARAEGRPR